MGVRDTEVYLESLEDIVWRLRNQTLVPESWLFLHIYMCMLHSVRIKEVIWTRDYSTKIYLAEFLEEILSTTALVPYVHGPRWVHLWIIHHFPKMEPAYSSSPMLSIGMLVGMMTNLCLPIKISFNQFFRGFWTCVWLVHWNTVGTNSQAMMVKLKFLEEKSNDGL